MVHTVTRPLGHCSWTEADASNMNESRSKQSLRFRPVRGGCVINRMATVRTMSRPLAIIMLVRRAVYLLHFCSFRRLILFPASKEGPVGEGVVHKEEDNETVHRQSVSPLLCRLRFDGSFYGQRLRPVLFSAVLILSPLIPVFTMSSYPCCRQRPAKSDPDDFSSQRR